MATQIDMAPLFFALRVMPEHGSNGTASKDFSPSTRWETAVTTSLLVKVPFVQSELRSVLQTMWRDLPRGEHSMTTSSTKTLKRSILSSSKGLVGIVTHVLLGPRPQTLETTEPRPAEARPWFCSQVGQGGFEPPK
jgi:hypothetical protein